MKNKKEINMLLLSDVLRFLSFESEMYYIDCKGNIHRDDIHFYCKWDLSKPRLGDQSDELKKWVYKIIKNENRNNNKTKKSSDFEKQ